MYQQQSLRRPRAFLSQFSITQIHPRNPWVIAFFSFSYPGFGNLLQHKYAKGFILIGWEMFINHLAKVNLGIMYTLLGQFDKAKEVIDERWLLMYVGIYMYSIWDSYRTTVDLNKLHILINRENAQFPVIKMSFLDINYLDKRSPWVALAWSAMVPGLGHLYVHKVIVGFFIFGYTILIMYYSNIVQAINYTMIFDFALATKTLNMQWTLYLPSIYLFFIYDSYVSAIEINKLFEIEMKNFLRKNYQDSKFKFPI